MAEEKRGGEYAKRQTKAHLHQTGTHQDDRGNAQEAQDARSGTGYESSGFHSECAHRSSETQETEEGVIV